MDISVKIGKIKFKNPVTVASGTFGHSEEYYDLKEVKQLGALTLKTITLKAKEGNPPPRILETPSGMLNAIGIENPGVDYFIQEKLPSLRKIGVPLIVSIIGGKDKDFQMLAKKLQGLPGVSALELNLSCPNLRQKTLVAQDPKATMRVIKAVKRVSEIPVIAKLSPNVTDITTIAQAAEQAGADGLSLVNTFSAMAIDVDKKSFCLGNVTGGLSGPAIRPIAVSMVYKTAQKVKIPIIAMGGIMNGRDAVEFLLAGATMVAVGTGNFVDPQIPLHVLQGIKAYMKKNKMTRLKSLIGKVNR